ncbi:MAG: DUF362 domain-containing protein [Candidatus Eisenbacteria bacterium]|nr:DUF362 domain-containing protein [Candidatus Eisenbacteria bacterium]
MRSKVAVFSTRSGSVLDCTRAILEELEWTKHIAEGASVVVKPNLSWPGKDRASYANTSPDVLDALIKILLERTDRITVGESDGTRFSVDECFEASGYSDVVARNRVRWVNFSRAATEPAGIAMLEGFELPVDLVHCDALITLPKLKTHALTYFTGALKNQWGCIPRYDRILLHKKLDDLIVELNCLLKPALCIMDGIWAMEGRGPVNGRKVRLDLLLGSRDPVALDATAMRLVGLEPRRARHVVMAAERGLGTLSKEDIVLTGDPGGQFKIEPARLERTVRLMNHMTRYPFFTKHILLNNTIFQLGKGVVALLRRIGLS